MNGNNLNTSKLTRMIKSKGFVTGLCGVLAVAVLIIGYNIRINNATKPVSLPVARVTIDPKTKITDDMIEYREGVSVEGENYNLDPQSMHCELGLPGTYRIIEEKFVESFVRRFSESAKLNRKYRIVIYDIDECPPKVSLSLISTERFSFLSFFDVHYESDEDAQQKIINSVSGILESKTPDVYE